MFLDLSTTKKPPPCQTYTFPSLFASYNTLRKERRFLSQFLRPTFYFLPGHSLLSISTQQKIKEVCVYYLKTQQKKPRLRLSISTTDSASLSSRDFPTDYKDNKTYYLLSTISLLHWGHFVSTFLSNLYIFICLDL